MLMLIQMLMQIDKKIKENQRKLCLVGGRLTDIDSVLVSRESNERVSKFGELPWTHSCVSNSELAG
jgi:hypothetical protein